MHELKRALNIQIQMSEQNIVGYSNHTMEVIAFADSL